MNLTVGRIIHVRRPNIDTECIAAIVTWSHNGEAKITKFPYTGGSTTHMTTRGVVIQNEEDVAWHDPRFCVYELELSKPITDNEMVQG